jgi:hypothetical protein
MNVRNLIGKRLLVTSSSFHSTVDEVKLLEVSPSGTWTKLMKVQGGIKYWKRTSEIAVIEELESSPRPEASK